ncbi:hypothetical protein [Ruminiclostridium cellulolyticum]|uniref:hypothetical protein n=1 Tax=Ruminiclostridium cellulolyticum TaxID=1521 RepID=UPI0002FD0595|nr:hypothetical protein [Ruminiclostridium cellulolyticum]
MVKVIFAFLLVLLASFKELLNYNKRAKVMSIYFTIMAISMLLSILISIDKQPTSPVVLIMNALKSVGLK